MCFDFGTDNLELRARASPPEVFELSIKGWQMVGSERTGLFPTGSASSGPSGESDDGGQEVVILKEH